MATGVADEALSNIHTVRSFAMEQQECMYVRVQVCRICVVCVRVQVCYVWCTYVCMYVVCVVYVHVHILCYVYAEPFPHRLYESELRKSCWLNEKLGAGIAVFQGLSNLAINGLVLVVVSHGGVLLATNQLTAGDLMSFLVATQIIQR